MKRFLLVAAALVISTSAFADAGGPIVRGHKCWAQTDQRGFGFWDQCADRHELARRAGRDGLTTLYPAAVTVGVGSTISNGDGGGGGGGGR
ncbi:MAG: hypothetical protein OJF62_001404 [Pseudolabrys sp.]|jgi:hypothetical protein|nr:hypothetical protein [Pseudolabrys sp.]